MKVFRNGSNGVVVGLELTPTSLAIAAVARTRSATELRFCEFHPAPAQTHAKVLGDVVKRRRLKGARCIAVVPLATQPVARAVTGEGGR